MMARRTNLNLRKEFRNYFDEVEGYALRSERFYAEFEAGIMREKRILEWMEAAYIAGARIMAQDTLDTLGDYACACAGLEPRLIKPETVYDTAESDLQFYYNKILDNVESKYSDIVSDGGMDPR
jgi:hypothetical protein